MIPEEPLSSPSNQVEGRTSIRTYTAPTSIADSLRQDLLDGFQLSPKTLLPKYFYDVLGSGIFDAITNLPEYYVARAETAAIGRYLRNIVDACSGAHLIDIGSGGSSKSLAVLEEMHRQSGDRIVYVPLDIRARRGIRESFGVWP